MFDSHAHYDDEAFNEDRDEVIQSAHDEGVEYIINVGSDVDSSETSIELSQKYNFIYAGVGVHPHDSGHVAKDYLEKLKDLTSKEKVVAIGEIGLDYHYNFSSKEEQKKCFIEQINLAQEVNLPMIIHNRESHEDMLNILKQEKVQNIGGVLHCFSGSKELAKEIVKMGLYIGIGGPVTFKNAKKTVEVVENTPIEFLLSETDCPYLSPVPYRGKRNDSRYMIHTIEKISQIKELSFEETSKILSNNAKKLFGIR